MKSNKKYWKGISQLENDPAIEKLVHDEFVEELPLDNFFSKNLGDTSTLLDPSVVEEIKKGAGL